MRCLVYLLACTVSLLVLPVPSPAAEAELTGTVKAVDAEKRTITVVPKGKPATEARQLDVVRKAKVTIDGKDSTLGKLSPGQEVTVVYDDKLEVVTVIRSGRPSLVEVLNVEELNTPGRDDSPFLTDDGLTIYWSSNGPNPSTGEFWVWTATREDAASLFEGKKRLSRKEIN